MKKIIRFYFLYELLKESIFFNAAHKETFRFVAEYSAKYSA